MSKLIIIRGPLGIGKTTIAKKLAEDLEARYFSIDQILDENKLDLTDPNSGGIALENFLKANQIILPEIQKLVGEGIATIVDGNFYFREAVTDLESKVPKTFVFTLKTPVEICILRDRERKDSYGEDAARAVHSMVSSFDYGETIETAKKDIDQVIEEILRKIG